MGVVGTTGMTGTIPIHDAVTGWRIEGLPVLHAGDSSLRSRMTEGRGRSRIDVTPVFTWPRAPRFRIRSGMTIGGRGGTVEGAWVVLIHDAVRGGRLTRCCRSRFGSRRGPCIGAGCRPAARGRFSRVFSWVGPRRRIICGPWTGRGQGFRGVWTRARLRGVRGRGRV